MDEKEYEKLPVPLPLEGWIGPRYRHVELSDGRRGTLCYAIAPDRLRVRLGWALCSKQDSFTRARGRQISFGRMMSPRTRRFVLLDTPLSKDNFRGMLNTAYLFYNIGHLVVGRSKLTPEQVREIRKVGMSLDKGKRLAAKFAVSEGVVHAVQKGKTWRNF